MLKNLKERRKEVLYKEIGKLGMETIEENGQ